MGNFRLEKYVPLTSANRPSPTRYLLCVEKHLEKQTGLIFVRNLMTSLSLFLSDSGFRDRIEKTKGGAALLLGSLEGDWEPDYALALTEDVYGERFINV